MSSTLTPPRAPSAERGSVLVYIFIAIIVLAALIFAVSRGGRESVSAVDRERAELDATQILDYVGMIRRAVQSITINGGRAQDLCFYTSGWGNADYDPVAGAPLECLDARHAIFDSAGGGATFQIPGEDLLDDTQSALTGYGKWHFTGANAVQGVGTDGNGADSNDLLVVLPYVTRTVCLALNKRLQIPNPQTLPVDDPNFDITTPFIGDFIGTRILNATDLQGRRSGCFAANTLPPDGSYVFYAVLVAR